MRSLGSLLGALGALLVCSAPLAAQSAAVKGRVVTEQSAPIAGAQVELVGAAGAAPRVQTTGADGGFAFDGLPAGPARLRAAAIGHSPVTREVTLAAGGAAELLLVLPASVVQLQAVEVVSLRTTVPVDAVPGAVSVVTRQEIEDQAALAASLGDMLGQVVPGLGAGMQAPGLQGQSLRGRNVAVLIDGVPQSTTRNVMRDLTTLDAAVVDRVEVLRGATALYGDGATGGVINIVTRTADSARTRFTTTVGGEMSGSEWGRGVGGRVSQTAQGRRGPVDFLVSGTASRVGDYYDAEGDLVPSDPHGQGGLAETNGYDLFGKVGLSLGAPRLQLSVNRFANEQVTDYVSDPSVNALPAGTRKAQPLGGLQLERNQGSENTIANLDLSGAAVLGSRLHAQLFYRDYTTVFRPNDARAVATRRAVIQSWLESEKAGGRLELETALPFGRRTAAGAPTLLWGADFTSETTSQPVYVFDPAAYDSSSALVYRRIDERVWVPVIKPRSLGLFAQLAVRPLDRLQLRGGVRHERARMQVPDFTTLIGNEVVGGRLDFSPTLFNVGAVVDATNELSAYASFSQGFSLADIGLALRDAPAGAVLGRKEMEAQEVDQYEVGLRAGWRDVQASLAAYRTTSELGTTSRGYDQPVVRAPERVYGLEATLDAQPLRTLGLGGTFGWSEGESFVTTDSAWHALNSFRIQPWKATAYVQHQTLPRWRNRLQVLVSGSRDRAYEERVNQNVVGFGERPVTSYWTLDWVAGVELGAGSLTLGVQNLLNRSYFPVVSQLIRSGGNDSYTAARGRSLSVGYTVTY